MQKEVKSSKASTFVMSWVMLCCGKLFSDGDSSVVPPVFIQGGDKILYKRVCFFVFLPFLYLMPKCLCDGSKSPQPLEIGTALFSAWSSNQTVF